MEEKPKENWGSAAPYERYVGRWSRQVARQFIDWISVPTGAVWADIGCGTGALGETLSCKFSDAKLFAAPLGMPKVVLHLLTEPAFR